jgi:hypothetical protein
MTPIRANIVAPPFSATRISASIAACHCGPSAQPSKLILGVRPSTAYSERLANSFMIYTILLSAL